MINISEISLRFVFQCFGFQCFGSLCAYSQSSQSFVRSAFLTFLDFSHCATPSADSRSSGTRDSVFVMFRLSLRHSLIVLLQVSGLWSFRQRELPFHPPYFP